MQIEISEATDVRLMRAARSLSDTYDTVIDRLLELWEKDTRQDPDSKIDNSVARYNPSNPPSLAFTSCDRITIAGKALPRSETNWNRMLFAMARYLSEERGLSGRNIIDMLTIANGELGRINDRGYRYIPEADISIQGKDSNSTFRQTYQLAVLANVPFEIQFHWRSNEGAAHPGKRAVLTFAP